MPYSKRLVRPILGGLALAALAGGLRLAPPARVAPTEAAQACIWVLNPNTGTYTWQCVAVPDPGPRTLQT